MKPTLSFLAVTVVALFLIASSTQADEPAAAKESAPLKESALPKVTAPPAEMKLDPFYKKYIDADGYPIVSSDKVSDYALREAAYLVNLLLAKRPDVRRAMVGSGSRMVVMAYNEFTTDVPEYKDFKPKDFWDRRARGLGGSQTDPLCSCAEENILAYVGDPYSTECILIHEFAHNIHLRGMVNLDPTFDTRLKKCYDDAIAKGLWKGKYASTNHHEYFAEGVQCWFDNNRPPDHDHNHVRTRVALKEYDPGLAAMCAEVFGETELKYTYPTTRLTGHLAGYDPNKSPKFVWPERLVKLGDEIKRDALKKRPGGDPKPADQKAASPEKKDDTKDGDKKDAGKVAALKYQTREIEGWTVHIRQELVDSSPEPLARAIEILTEQLKGIVRDVPAPAVAELKKVPLWMSPEYPNIRPSAEYHPDAKWLREHGRNPEMARGVEFTNVRIFDAELKRMPVFVLHELAHAYHHRVLGHDEESVRKAYAHAQESKIYEAVERWRGADKPPTKERAYAMTNDKEYFAETSEAYFGRNDFFPYVREELQRHDPEMFQVLERVWNLPAAAETGKKP